MNALFMLMNEPMKNTKLASIDNKMDTGAPSTKKSKVATVYFAPLTKNIFIKLYFTPTRTLLLTPYIPLYKLSYREK